MNFIIRYFNDKRNMGCTQSKKSAVKEIDLKQPESPDIKFGCQNPIPIFILDETGHRVDDVGGGNEKLKAIMGRGRQEIKEAQEKLNSSLTIPLVDAEAKVLETGNWLYEKKDVQRRFNVLPPIAGNKKVKGNSMAFEV